MSTIPQPEVVQAEGVAVSAEYLGPAAAEAASPEDQGEEADKHALLDPTWIMKTKSTKRKLTSSVWEHCLELTDQCPMKDKGFTHVCILPLGGDGGCCNTFLKLGKNASTGKFITTRGSTHFRVAHGADCQAGIEAVTRHEENDVEIEGKMRSAGTPLGKFMLSKDDLALTAMARWFIYSSSQVRKSEFESPLFKEMARAIGTKDTPIIGKASLELFIKAEFKIFQKYLRKLVELARETALGNPFAQWLHDGATLKDHLKYQAIGIQLVDPLWRGNHTIALALVCVPCLCPMAAPAAAQPAPAAAQPAPANPCDRRCSSGTNDTVAELLANLAMSRLGVPLTTLGTAMRSDRAAQGPALRTAHSNATGVSAGL